METDRGRRSEVWDSFMVIGPKTEGLESLAGAKARIGRMGYANLRG
jgi:hypothetical protein